MENTTIINYIEAAFLLQHLTDPELAELKKILADEMILELSDPGYVTIDDRVEQIIDIGREYDHSRLETFIKQQNISPVFIQDEISYYQVTNELDNAITIFFQQ